MNEINRGDEDKDSKISNILFEKLVKISLIIGIIVVSGFILYYFLTPEPGDITFGILNENQEAGSYTKKAQVNETIFFYLTVGNYLNRDFIFHIEIKKGNSTTHLSPIIPSNGTLDYSIGNFTLRNNEFFMSNQLNISFSEVGEDQMIIAELWQINRGIDEYFDILYLQLNITS